ncbi:Formin-like protein 17 [Hibiscus syriacus]|uniref:Formin-like protein 17 n=1 Tax=Hibiscus syriacus TaxID=106335 RepID=A0A6A2WRT8_HIBSY|nr:Formin-like protein 17 [Hibiscus syriacus]
MHRRTPSFSSTLLDAIYRSIDDSGDGNEPALCRYGEKTSANPVKKQSSGAPMEVESSRRPKPSRVMERNRDDRSRLSTINVGGSTTSTGCKRPVKQPISPGGRITGFLNSIFNANAKKVKMCSDGVSGDVGFHRKSRSTASSPSSFSRSCLSKTPSSGANSNSKYSNGLNGTKRSVKFCPVSVTVDEDCRPCGHKCIHEEDPRLMSSSTVQRNLKVSSRTEELKKKESAVCCKAIDYVRSYQRRGIGKMDLRRFIEEYDDEDEEDDALSCSSSDLFELDHLIGVGRYREELPVYDTTWLKSNQAIVNGFMLTKQHRTISVSKIYRTSYHDVGISLTDCRQSAILALDDTALDPDQIENLIKFCPTKEEIELLKGHTGDRENLGKREQFFLELMTVPPVESKLRVFLFKIQFYSQVSDLRNSLDIVNSAVGEASSAVGFRLDSLLKLTDTRARNKKMTLMHYLCKVLSQKLPELIDFPKDLATLESATKVQLKCLADEMQAISKGLEKVIQELAASEKDGPVSATFCKTVKEFLSFAEGEVKSLTALHTYVDAIKVTLDAYSKVDLLWIS